MERGGLHLLGQLCLVVATGKTGWESIIDHPDSMGGGSCPTSNVFCGHRSGEWRHGICKPQPGVNSEPEKQLKQKQMRIIRRDCSEG